LAEALRSLDARAFELLPDKENPRRLIRALERAEGGGSAPRGWRLSAGGGEVAMRAPLVGLSVPPEELHARIARRVQAMYSQGLIDEVRGLMERYGALSETAAAAIGYAEAAACIKGSCGVAEAMERTMVRTRQLAKRQRTWFRHQADVRWVEADGGMSVDDMADRVWKLWGEYGSTAIRE
jgi:tRNA dimethylallyltransferase